MRVCELRRPRSAMRIGILAAAISALALCVSCGNDECEDACERFKRCPMAEGFTSECRSCESPQQEKFAECVNEAASCEAMAECIGALVGARDLPTGGAATTPAGP